MSSPSDAKGDNVRVDDEGLDKHLLCSPPNAVFAVDKVRYVQWKSKWDGGPFMSFARREGLIGSEPWDLFPNVESTRDKNETTNEELSEKRHGFYQTWFFFGLLAEFYCLNELDDGTRLTSGDTKQALDNLYLGYLDAENKYIDTSELFLDKVGEELIGNLTNSSIGGPKRFGYLRECLSFTFSVVHHPRVQLEAPILSSICGLAELFTVTMSLLGAASKDHQFSDGKPLGFPWGRKYLDAAVEKTMTEKGGWCNSDVEQARYMFGHLNSQHYLSRLKKWDPESEVPEGGAQNERHAMCSQHACNAAQIDRKTYKLSHYQCGCNCEEIEVDIDRVQEILRTPDAYPVLLVDGDDDEVGTIRVRVEPYGGQTPYVALSHVWADGLGNYERNSLQRCQVSRLGNLVRNLQRATKDDGPRYWLWVDTLCCPVEMEGKMRALERIADVYRQARHVLVLDSSINPPTEADKVWVSKASSTSGKEYAAEVCFRALASSIWMRRLWTLQEGALAKSLYFQFGDHPISILDQMWKLFDVGCKDLRYMALWKDVNLVITGLNEFSKDSPDQTRLSRLQRHLYFRSVSFAADEPLCIATLLSLKSATVIEQEGRDERMAQIWKLEAEKSGGIPSRIIFYVDHPLPLPGWGWAPRSLLSSDPGPESALDFHDVTTRLSFAPGGIETGFPELGVPTKLGLRVVFPGSKLTIRSWRKDCSATPMEPLWEGLVPVAASELLCRHAATGKWHRMVDFCERRVVRSSPDHQGTKQEQNISRPILQSLCHDRMALIQDPVSAAQGASVTNLLVECQEAPYLVDEKSAIKVHALKTVVLAAVDEIYSRGVDIVKTMAAEVANNQVTTDLLGIKATRGKASAEYAAGLEKVKRVMKQKAADKFKKGSPFYRFGMECLGITIGEKMWGTIPYLLPYDVVLEDLRPRDQVWLVDRAI